MIRKAIINVLAVAAVGVGALYTISSLEGPIVLSAEFKQRAIQVEFAEGHLDVAVFHLRPATGFFAVTPNLEIERAEYRLSRQMRQSVRAIRRERGDVVPGSRKFYCDWYPGGSGATASLAINVGCPLGFLFPVLAAFPAYAVIRGPVCRYRRRKRGLCLKCAYNLTGNTSGVCPECGTAIDPLWE